ncbi:MAG: hypothetical protein FJZ58_05950, partial [Chlamydiae bacterium]|nr:hypothetical protein [Chlamydiota bacterium]
MENKPVQPMEVFTDPRQISLDQQEASPFTLPLHWGPGISGIAAIKDVWHQGKIFLSSFFYTPEELGLSQEEVSRAPYALFSYVSNVNYAIFYVGNLILLLGRDIIHIHESLPVIQFVSKFILPLTCIVALIDTGL